MEVVQEVHVQRHVRVEVTVQRDQVVQQDVEHENIEVVREERVRVIVVQQVHDIMQIHHVARQHVDEENGVKHEVQAVVQ